MVAGHGIAGWALMLAGGTCAAMIQLSRRAGDAVAPPPTPLGAVAGVLALIALLVAFALGARAVVVAHPWLAALLALTAGAAAGALLRWWQLRPVARPA
ncbi:hypothetical protein Cph01nite_02250 [Cellulomonas phragmiteti]|uniref:Uncharacterized protein n=2 Tax=Cellulomonas phragmiteti TaxID=478780 RepID=A0ABQ4DGJ2_9CELL|nr:hypothetical protein Cph01nite_02250 [Cellulomonas phragmiteti]